MYIFSGTSDTIVAPVVVRQTKALYESLGVYNATANFGAAAQHCWPTDDNATNATLCEVLKPPYICNCGLDGAGEALATLYAPEKLKPRASAPRVDGLFTFKQGPLALPDIAAVVGLDNERRFGGV